MKKAPELNQELLRQRLIEIYNEYVKSKGNSNTIKLMKEVVEEYDSVIMLLDETLNCSIGLFDAIVRNEIKDKKEEAKYVEDMLKELNSKDYLSVGLEEEKDEGKDKEVSDDDEDLDEEENKKEITKDKSKKKKR